MKIKEKTFYKEFKCGLPNYSNITLSYGMTVGAEKGEEIDNEKCWDEVNHQLNLQSDGIDPSWIQTKEYSNFFKTSIRTQKEGSEEK